jgi:hypothetical protein
MFRRKLPERVRSIPTPVPVEHRRAVTMVTPDLLAKPAANAPKESTHRSDKWLRAVASLDCVLCGREGTQAAHRNEGKGMGLKVDDCWTAALCPQCHSEIDQGKDMSRAERREAIDRAILLTLQQLARKGLVKA